jgi:hypothetical protein
MVDTMRTYGLASHALDELKSAWAVRVKTLTRERYDPYGDLLYTHLLESIVPTKEVLFNTLLTTISTATSAKELEVPLWSYTAAYSKVPGEPVHETRIGTSSMGVIALPAVPVYKVLQHTDVLAHLASSFGADFHIYDRHVEILSETDERCQSKRELVLSFYPRGLPSFLLTKVVEAYNRHFNRSPYSPSWAEVVEVHDPLSTPPQSPASSPPRLPRKCYCGDLSDEESVL